MMTSPIPAPSGATHLTPAETDRWSKLRVRVFIGSVCFLLSSVVASVIVPALQEDGTLPSPLTEVLVRHELPSRRAAEEAYAARLRTDAQRLAGEGDYENALLRLDQAADHDRQGDRNAEIQRTRQDLRARLGEVTDLDHAAHGGFDTP